MADKTETPLVVIGMLGTTLDAGLGPNRWERWRPTVSLFQSESATIARLELLCPDPEAPLAKLIAKDVVQVSPETEVVLRPLIVADPWDFEAMWAALHDYAVRYAPRLDEARTWIHITTGTHVAQICLFLLTESGFLPGLLVQTGPPRRGGPPSLTTIDLHRARYDQIAKRWATRAASAVGRLEGGLESRNPAFHALMGRVERVATQSRAPILITGATGAGKTVLARRIYDLRKERRLVGGALVEVNCATLRGDGAMSTLFGHRRGAFTGASEDRKGLLAAADGGLLFLDEIGELGLDEQAMLLRAVEEKRFLPLGADRETISDFQLIVGTCRDLRAAVGQGRFREDLLARIDTWHFHLPGLSERPEDVEAIFDSLLDRVAANEGRRVRANREARARFLAWAKSAPWPGNFRDFDGVITRLATLAEGGRIDVSQVDEEITSLEIAWRGNSPPSASAMALGAEAAAALDRFDRVQLDDVLAVCARSPTLSEAGRVLFGASIARRTSRNDADRLTKYLARFGLRGTDVLRRSLPG